MDAIFQGKLFTGYLFEMWSPKMLYKKAILNTFAIIAGKNSLCFPVNIAKFLETPILK